MKKTLYFTKKIEQPGLTPKTKFTKILKSQNRFSQNYLFEMIDDRVLCSISGGQDSITTLFVLLHNLKIPFQTFKRFGQNTFLKVENVSSPQVIYCNHFWQRKNFFSSFLIYQLSFLFKIPYTLILPQSGLVNENYCRVWRRKKFTRLAQFEKFCRLVTGHNQTDILETNLNNLFRGTSLKGLQDFSSQNFDNKNLSFFERVNDFKFLNFKSSKELFFSNLILRIFLVRKTYKKNNLKSKSFTNLENYSFSQTRQFQKDFMFLKISQKNTFFVFPMRRLEVYLNEETILREISNSRSFCFYGRTISNTIVLEKPLSNFSRITIRKLKNFYNLPFINDRTNFSVNFARNKLRHEFFPFIKLLYNKKVDLSLIHFLKILKLDQKDREKQFQEVFFLFYLLETNDFDNNFSYFYKQLEFEKKGFLMENLLFQYKNNQLNFSQILKLQALKPNF